MLKLMEVVFGAMGLVCPMACRISALLAGGIITYRGAEGGKTTATNHLQTSKGEYFGRLATAHNTRPLDISAILNLQSHYGHVMREKQHVTQLLLDGGGIHVTWHEQHSVTGHT